MQTPKTRIRSLDACHATKIPRVPPATRGSGSESESSSAANTPRRLSAERANVTAFRRSPRSSATEKKRPTMATEPEAKISQLQEELRRAKEQLSASEALKRKVHKDAEDGKKQPQSMHMKLEDSQLQLKKRPSMATEPDVKISQLQEELRRAKEQLSASETSKRKVHKEAEDAKKQLQSMHMKLEDSQFQLVEFSKAEESRLQELRRISQDRDRAWQSELHAIQRQHDMDSVALGSAKAEIQRLKLQLEAAATGAKIEASRGAEHSEATRSETVENLETQLRDSREAEATARRTAAEAQQQLNEARSNFEALRADGFKLVALLKSKAAELQESNALVGSLHDIVSNLQQKSCEGNAKLELEQLKSALEAAEINKQERQIQSVMEVQAARESAAGFESALKCAKAEISDLKARMIDRDAKMQSMLQEAPDDIADLNANLMDKETELQRIQEENELLRSEAARRDAENRKRFEAAMAQVELAKAAELDAARALNSELEGEMKRLKVQLEQWRKAAETAAAVLATESGRLMERSVSMEADYDISGSFSPFSSDDRSDDSPKMPKNGKVVLKKIGVLWKRGPK